MKKKSGFQRFFSWDLQGSLTKYELENFNKLNELEIKLSDILNPPIVNNKEATKLIKKHQKLINEIIKRNEAHNQAIERASFLNLSNKQKNKICELLRLPNDDKVNQMTKEIGTLLGSFQFYVWQLDSPKPSHVKLYLKLNAKKLREVSMQLLNLLPINCDKINYPFHVMNELNLWGIRNELLKNIIDGPVAGDVREEQLINFPSMLDYQINSYSTKKSSRSRTTTKARDEIIIPGLIDILEKNDIFQDDEEDYNKKRTLKKFILLCLEFAKIPHPKNVHKLKIRFPL